MLMLIPILLKDADSEDVKKVLILMLIRPAACSPMAPQWRAGDDEGLLRPVTCSPMLGDTYSPMTEMTDLSTDRSDRLENLSSYVQPGYIFMERE